MFHIFCVEAWVCSVLGVIKNTKHHLEVKEMAGRRMFRKLEVECLHARETSQEGCLGVPLHFRV